MGKYSVFPQSLAQLDIESVCVCVIIEDEEQDLVEDHVEDLIWRIMA